jgi:hypothetical protein
MMRRGWILGGRAIAAAALFAAIQAGIAQAAQPIGFAQADAAIQFSANDAKRLKALFASDKGVGLMPDAAAMLAKAAPGLAPSCDAMVNGWGAAARDTGVLTVREIGRTPGIVWIAYRCASGDQRFSRDYTERIAAFDPASGALRFFSLDADDEKAGGGNSAAPALYHVAFAEALKLRGGADAASFFVYADGDSPGSRVANPIAEDHLLIIAGIGASMRPALSLLTMRKRTARANGGTVHVVTYRARLQYVHDANGSLSAVVAYRRAGVAGHEPARSVAMRYVWDRRGHFESAPGPPRTALK